MSTTYARTINGNLIYSSITDADSNGNSITSTYATKTEVGQVRQVPASTSSDEDKVLTVNSSGTPEWASPATITVDQSYNASSTNAQSGTAVAEAIAGISVEEVPTVTSNDDGKVLQASYDSGTGTGSYAWTTPPKVDEVPDVTSGDDAKLLKATYSGGTGSYAWETVAIPVIGTITINDPQDNQNNGGGDNGGANTDIPIEEE